MTTLFNIVMSMHIFTPADFFPNVNLDRRIPSYAPESSRNVNVEFHSRIFNLIKVNH